MAIITQAALETQATTIQNETQQGANTAGRVGGFGLNLVQTLFDQLKTRIQFRVAAGQTTSSVHKFEHPADTGVYALESNYQNASGIQYRRNGTAVLLADANFQLGDTIEVLATAPAGQDAYIILRKV